MHASTARRVGEPFASMADHYTQVAHELPWEAIADVAETERADIARQWAQHACDEYRAMCLFAGLAADLVALAQPFDVVAAVHRLVRDELRHVDLCLRVVAAAGGELPALVPPPEPRTGATLEARVAEGMLSGVYVAETASLHIIGAARRQEPHAVLRDAMQLILRDESLHSRFGAEWLRYCWPQWPAEAKAHAERALPTTFARLQDGLPPHLAAAAARAIGTIAVPTLDALGMPASAAWAALR